MLTNELNSPQQTFDHIKESYLNAWGRFAAGWTLINAIHDTLLTSGSIALPLAIQYQFGEDIWQKYCQDVLGEQL